jgi:nitrogen fixation protein FixH
VSGLDGTDTTRAVQVRIKDRTGLPVDRLEGELRLLRPGAAQAAFTLPLNALGAGTYGGVLRLPGSGRWVVELRVLYQNEVGYQFTQELVAP